MVKFLQQVVKAGYGRALLGRPSASLLQDRQAHREFKALQDQSERKEAQGRKESRAQLVLYLMLPAPADLRVLQALKDPLAPKESKEFKAHRG